MLEKTRRNGYKFDNIVGHNFVVKTSQNKGSANSKFDVLPSETRIKIENKPQKARSLCDVITNDSSVSITIDMPDATKQKIRFRTTKDTIEIMPDKPTQKYHKCIRLPCTVQPETATFTYKNGVLDIGITRN